jgi:hypothetical protein
MKREPFRFEPPQTKVQQTLVCNDFGQAHSDPVYRRGPLMVGTCQLASEFLGQAGVEFLEYLRHLRHQS